MYILLGALCVCLLVLLVLAVTRKKWFGAAVSERIQTVCTIVQTLVVAVGVVFAVVELKNWTTERDQQRIEKTLELLAGFNEELSSAVEVVDQAWSGTFTAGMPWMQMVPQMSAEDFDNKTKPLLARFHMLQLCLRSDACQLEAGSGEFVCSLLQTYHLAWVETRPPALRPSQPGEKWRGAPTVMLDYCPSVRERLSRFYEFAPDKAK